MQAVAADEFPISIDEVLDLGRLTKGPTNRPKSRRALTPYVVP